MPPCDGCSRRDLIRGIAVGAAGVLIAACGGSSAPAVDAAPDIDAAPPAATMCGANLCIDLTNPEAAALLLVGGTMVVVAPHDRIIVLRESDTVWVVLSDICTHAGCSVQFSASLSQMTCACHGSRFALTGKVTRGPAQFALHAYASSFDATAQILTIML